MKIGTKSILYGYHQFLIHPLFVAWAWWKLFGFPWDPRLWVACFVHDLGYWGKPNMDGKEGESHPRLGAKIMHTLFDGRACGSAHIHWYHFCLFHSRFSAKKIGHPPSRLCYADKLAIVITPTWLQLVLMNLTGEVKEYMAGKDGRTVGEGKTQREWVEEMKQFTRAWLSEQMGTCVECGVKCSERHWMCDESAGFAQWCPKCFDKTPCGRGEHGEQCPTYVAALHQ